MEETERFFSTRNYQCLSGDKSSTNVFSKYDIWLSNVVIVKSDGPEVKNSSKSHGEEDVKFENER